MLLLLLCLLPSLAFADLYEFHGFLGQGTVDGTFETQTGPNATYTPSAWSFNVVNNWSLLPGTIFSSSLVGQMASWCQGACLFASGSDLEALTLRNGSGLRLQLVFNGSGGFLEGDYRVEPFVPQSSLVSGTLTDPPTSVPEPSSLALLLWASIGLLLGAATYKELYDRGH